MNVRPPEYWAEQFARQGFVRDVDFDASFITPWAVRFRRSAEPLHRVIAGLRTLARAARARASRPADPTRHAPGADPADAVRRSPGRSPELAAERDTDRAHGAERVLAAAAVERCGQRQWSGGDRARDGDGATKGWCTLAAQVMARSKAPVRRAVMDDRAAERPTLGRTLRGLFGYGHLLRNLVVKDLKLKYRGSVLASCGRSRTRS